MAVAPNPGKRLEIVVSEKTWLRYPIKTPLIFPQSDYLEIYKKALVTASFQLEKDDIVFAGEKPKWRLASCCKVEVMNGGTGCLFFSFFSTPSTL